MAAFHIGAVAAMFFFSWKAVMVATFLWWILGSFGIGMGYHRLLTHRGYRTPKWVEYFLTAACGGWPRGGFHTAFIISLRINKAIRTPRETVNGGHIWAGFLRENPCITTLPRWPATYPTPQKINSIFGSPSTTTCRSVDVSLVDTRDFHLQSDIGLAFVDVHCGAKLVVANASSGRSRAEMDNREEILAPLRALDLIARAAAKCGAYNQCTFSSRES